MSPQEIRQKLQQYHAAGKRIFISSSFQTHSIPLLHLVTSAEVPVDVLFIDTGFHFPETLAFRDEVASMLGIKVIDVRSQVPKNLQKDGEGQFYFVSDPDYCCFLNKRQAMEPYLMEYDIWISGVRADQSATRSRMQVEQEAPFHTTRFHPILDWNAKRIYEYRKEFGLPEHPLEKQGYLSIGCAPCTSRMDQEKERNARWYGMNKTECGLHTELATK